MTSTPSFDTRRFKDQERRGFNRIATAYADGAGARAALAQALLDAAALAPGLRVLDLASGPCLLAREAAGRVAPDGLVVASDLAEGMLAEGARRAAESQRPVCVAADAERLCLPDGGFDRVLAGLALFLFPHPERALAEARRVLRPGGRLVLSVWGARGEVPLIECALACLARVLPPPRVARPSVQRYGDAAVLHDTLAAAGFHGVELLPCEFTCRFADAAAYWNAFLSLAGGAAEALAQHPADVHARLAAEAAHELAPYRDAGGGYSVPARTLIASARR
ncbi:methyltransferase domain-containing protein [Pseudothauera nasutitermitis]|uniref:Methyltransferase domain-containing protein n=1 Tax=Pseudothauera nasutitermitis TaxID=2565930 RepID=A0A4S4AQC7_9RHOO|nr:methyltransferase domain-containing protein [Pseudothauera nasutitermitis]THF61948.1 methyltransferase domain-containing protein [Pseudothauera nasutitermitis]